VFFSNLLHLAGSTIAAIYKERWKVELFFKALKTKLESEDFPGHQRQCREDAVWTALIAMLILKYLQMKSTSAGASNWRRCCDSNCLFSEICGLAEQSDGGATGGAATRRAVADAADV